MRDRLYVGKPYTRKIRLRETREFVAATAYLKTLREVLCRLESEGGLERQLYNVQIPEEKRNNATSKSHSFGPTFIL